RSSASETAVSAPRMASGTGFELGLDATNRIVIIPADRSVARRGPTTGGSLPERDWQQWAALLGFDEGVRLRERHATLRPPAAVHVLVRLPDRARLLAPMLLESPLLDLADRHDVEVQLGPEGDGLLVGHHLEEIEVPAAPPLVALPDQGADDVVIRVGIQRPVRHHDVRLHLVEPGGH